MTPEHRPSYHFLPPANWMNDPNGLIELNGRWHLFYQHNPHGAFWGTMHWGHATSTDLVHWHHMPIALAPEEHGPDQGGCYSGATVVHDGVPTIVYTGVRDGNQLPCLATSDDPDLATWWKDPSNPVIQSTPEELDLTIFRDHTLWREDNHWMMGVGSGIKGRGGAVLLYRSRDLHTWHFLGPLVVEDADLNAGGRGISTGWECPDFFFLDGEPVLIACEWDGDPRAVSYWTGIYTQHRFEPHLKGVVDPGVTFYAPQTTTDYLGRRVMFGWLRELRSDAAQRASGWSGAMTLPRLVSRNPDGTLAFAVAPEVDALRGRRAVLDTRTEMIDIAGIPPDRMELDVSVDHGASQSFEIVLCRSASEDERTIVTWSEGTLSLDTTQASSDPGVAGAVAETELHLGDDDALSLRIFVDRSVIEVYANDRVVISGRMYPLQQIDGRIRLVSGGDSIRSLIAYEMQAI